MKLIQIAQDFFQISIDYFQGWSFYRLSRQPVTVFSVFLSCPVSKLFCIHFGIFFSVWVMKASGFLGSIRTVVSLVGTQIWKTFGSSVVVEKVARTELQSSLVCSVLGMKGTADTLSTKQCTDGNTQWRAETSNWLLITCGMTYQD